MLFYLRMLNSTLVPYLGKQVTGALDLQGCNKLRRRKSCMNYWAWITEHGLLGMDTEHGLLGMDYWA